MAKKAKYKHNVGDIVICGYEGGSELCGNRLVGAGHLSEPM